MAIPYYIGNYSHETAPLNEYVYALNRFTGVLKWKKTFQTIWDYDLGSLSLTKPILKDGAFFTASSQGRMVKLNAKTGHPVWEKNL